MPAKIPYRRRNKRGLILCKHSRVIYNCKECGNGNLFCKHGVRKHTCVPCKGYGICKHNKVRIACRDCGGSAFCEHNKFRSKCADCHPVGVYKDYKRGARKRGLKFFLTFKKYLEISSLPCSYCGRQEVRNGIDRKDNSSGYTLENSGPCCSKCNLMKRNYSVKEFLEHAKRITSFQSKRGK